MKFRINKLIIAGFKGYKEETVINLGDKTVFKGKNGVGKSSVGEAICWCLTGCDIFGNEKATTKLVNDSKPKLTEIYIEGTLDDKPITINRRKKGSSNEIYINDAKSNTADIAKMIYEEKEIFLSIFNPYYFPNLQPKDAKAILSKVLKPIAQEEVLDELGDYLKGVLKDNGFRNPNTFIQDKNSDIKEQKENIIHLEGVIAGSKKEDVPEKREFTGKEMLLSLKAQLKSLATSNEDKEKLDELKLKRSKIESLLSKGCDQKPLHDTVSLSRKKGQLLAKYNEIKNKIANFLLKEETCPHCGEVLGTNEGDKLLLEKELEKIKHEGTECKNQINNFAEENNLIKEENEKEAAKFRDYHNEQLKNVGLDIADLEGRIKEHEDAVKAKREELETEIQRLMLEEADVENHNSFVDHIIKKNEEVDKEIEKAKERIKNSENKIEVLKVAIQAAKQFNSVKLSKQTDSINKYLDKVELSFEELTKDGEIKEKFKILYDGKEFNKLSNGEKVKAGLEISMLISNTTGVDIPIVIDNFESITDVPDIDRQILFMEVNKEKENIEVEVIK